MNSTSPCGDVIVCVAALFVNVGENTSVLDQIKLTFVYDDVGQFDSLAEDEVVSCNHCVTS